MKTSKPISTISYNTESFLAFKIQEWKRKGLIEYAMWIWHKAEEGEKKDHWHVYMKPAMQVQTMDFEKWSQEIDPKHELPLKMIMFQSSKESEWLPYVLHDRDYLATKGLVKKYHYDISDIKCTDYDVLNNIIMHVNDERQGRLEYRILDACRMGVGWSQLVASGMIPIRFIHGAKIFYDSIAPAVFEDGKKENEQKLKKNSENAQDNKTDLR